MKLLCIDVDSVRADHVGGYGYDRATTPNVDGLIDDGAPYSPSSGPIEHPVLLPGPSGQSRSEWYRY